MTSQRLDDLKKFYTLMDGLTVQLGGPRKLAVCHARMNWPQRGVYFFMENGEDRSDSGAGPRVVRVGTHAVSKGSRATLWTRLSLHRSGNRTASVFRKLVGTALIARGKLECRTWGAKSVTDAEREAVRSLEQKVSSTIGAMPFVWLIVDDEPSKDSLRSVIERNAIALLSNHNKHPLDAPSAEWLGHHCSKEQIRKSGQWNSVHVDKPYDPSFLNRLEDLIHQQERSI